MSAQTHVLDTAIVSASKLNTSLKSANRNVIVLKGKEIENAPVQTISELLDFAAGIDARQRGALGTQTDLSIRGGTYEQVLVMLNGIRLSDPQTGHHLMNLPVSKSQIERIEILLGGGSYIFGGSAFSGAVNIITKDADSNNVSIDAQYGSHNSYSVGFIQNLKGKNHQTSISLSTTSSDGFKENTDFDIQNISARSNIQAGKYDVNIDGGFTAQNFGAQGFYSSAFPEQYEKTRTLFLNLGLKSGDKVKIDRQVYWRRNYDQFQLFREGDGYYHYDNGLFINGRDTVPGWYTSHNYHRTDVLGGKLEASFKSSLGKTAIGAEYRLEHIVSNNLGEPLEEPIDIPGSRGAYTLGAQRQNISLSAEHSKTLFHKLDLSAALLLNNNSDYDMGLYPAITAGYNIDKKNKVYGSFNKSFRFPSYTDLYYNLGGAKGSKNLKPESSLNYELGYKLLTQKLFFNLSFFRREGKNIIDWIQYSDTSDLLASNTSEVNFSGVDATLRFNEGGFFKALKMDFLEVGYSYLIADHIPVDYESLYVFDYLKNKSTLRAQHTFIKNLSWSYSLSFQDRNGSYTDAKSGKLVEYPTILMINTRLSYRYKMANIFLSGENLLNKSYYDRGNVQLPGAWFWTGINLTL